jgi:hypothetical protein
VKYYDIDSEWDKMSLIELIAYEAQIDAHENTFEGEYDDEENEDAPINNFKGEGENAEADEEEEEGEAWGA